MNYSYEDYLNDIKKGEMNEGLKKALCRIAEFENVLTQAIDITHANGHSVKNISDYDTDGIMSSLILDTRYDIDETVIADRYRDGYGIPNDLSFLQEGDLVILTDIGSDSIDKLKEIIERTNTTPFIIDHHEMSDELKQFVNEGVNGIKPMLLNFFDGTYEKGKEPDYCATGLCYRIALADKEALTYKQKQLISTYMANGTIGDVVKVNSPYDTNREDVLNGFHTIENLEEGFEPKFGYLLYATGLTEKPHMTTEAIQYSLSPITTLGKRMNSFEGQQCNVGQKIFDILKPEKDWQTNYAIKDDYIRAINKLIELNDIRKKEVAKFEGKDYKSFLKTCKDNIVIYVNDKIPEGYVGLIAQDISKAVKKPAMVFTKDNKGDYVASGRNAEGYPDILKSCTTKIEKHIGGHTDAFGVTVSAKDIFKYIDTVKETYKSITPVKVDKPTLNTEELKTMTVEKITALEPFGTDYPKVEVENTIEIGSKSGKDGGWNTIFNADETDKTRYFGLGVVGAVGGRIDVKGTLSANYFRGVESVMLTVNDSGFAKEKKVEKAEENKGEEQDEYEVDR